MAAGKLQEVKWIPQRPVTYPLQNVDQPRCCSASRSRWRLALVAASDGAVGAVVFPVIIVLALLFGVLLIIPIGGADMPTVIALLNSYAGLSAVAMGFVLDNKLLITAGALDGSSGPDPLDHHVQGDEPLVHQRAVRRLRPGAGRRPRRRAARPYKSETPKGAAQILEQASLVVIVPGYGMAVAQAQHKRARALRPADEARHRRASSPSIRSPAACRAT